MTSLSGEENLKVAFFFLVFFGGRELMAVSGNLLSKITCRPVEVVLLFAASKVRAVTVCRPSETVVEFQLTE